MDMCQPAGGGFNLFQFHPYLGNVQFDEDFFRWVEVGATTESSLFFLCVFSEGIPDLAHVDISGQKPFQPVLVLIEKKRSKSRSFRPKNHMGNWGNCHESS